VESCEVGWSAFNALNDGDEVSVATSRVFKSCDGIRRGDEVIASRTRAGGSCCCRSPSCCGEGAQPPRRFGWIQFERRVDDDTRGWWFS
jgi:hypothetical protein